MIPILYAPSATNFTSNGLGGLTDCISCTVTEVRNGQYTLDMVYPITGIRYNDITYSSILKVTPADGVTAQLFRIYKISKPLNGKVSIEADHISYQLSFIPCGPFTAANCAAAMAGLKSNSLETNPFTFWTDKQTTATYTQTTPDSIRARLGGVTGSILDTYGGEFEFDNYTVKLHNNRGTDRGVTLRYGKNITDIKQEENISKTVTGVCPYWTDGENTVTGAVQYTDNYQHYPFKRTIVKDFSSEFENTPTATQLENKAQEYISENELGVPSVSIDVSFVALWQTDEYKDIANLERVKLCDTVKVEFEKLNITATAKVVKTVYNVLLGRYDKIEIGSIKSTLAGTLTDNFNETNERIKQESTQLELAQKRATELITGQKGGYVVLNRDGNGYPYEILIMDTPSINTATKVWRWNNAGLGYSANGYQGPYTTAITSAGEIVADFITTGTLDAEQATITNINADNINTGHLSASRITGTAGTGETTFTLDGNTGSMSAKNATFTNGSITSASLKTCTAESLKCTSGMRADRITTGNKSEDGDYRIYIGGTRYGGRTTSITVDGKKYQFARGILIDGEL